MEKIVVVGLGYVGLPLATAFGSILPTVGFDINKTRIKELKSKVDKTCEIEKKYLYNAIHLTFTDNKEDIRGAKFYIITVPTPIDEHRQPNLTHIIEASKLVASILDPGSIVIFESTVYPGATEEICVPIIEKTSGFKFNQDFYVGYSPGRINPGDKSRTISDIVKVTSGSTPEVADLIDGLYNRIIGAGTYKAESIKVAEAAKVIENTQRDLNIALVNELSQIFSKLKIDTHEVLNAAASKWNFHKYIPGLVGGHCIGVDPYYLTHKAESVGHHPQLILAGRRINDQMAHLCSKAIKMMIAKDIELTNAEVLVLGIAFKNNCSDIRNSKVVDLVNELEDYGFIVDVYDPIVDRNDVQNQYNLNLISSPKLNNYQLIILAVDHDEFVEMDIEHLRDYGAKSGHVLFDLKSVFDRAETDTRL